MGDKIVARQPVVQQDHRGRGFIPVRFDVKVMTVDLHGEQTQQAARS
jgi:hypothetical protein